MKVVKRTDDYVIYQKRSGRYAVKNSEKKWVNAEEKVQVLTAEELIKAPQAAAPEPEAEESVAEEPAVEEEAAEETEELAAEETAEAEASEEEPKSE